MKVLASQTKYKKTPFAKPTRDEIEYWMPVKWQNRGYAKGGGQERGLNARRKTDKYKKEYNRIYAIFYARRYYAYKKGKLKDFVENNNALIEYVLYELNKQFSELNSNANEFYAEWGNDSQVEENKEKQEEILTLIKGLTHKNK